MVNFYNNCIIIPSRNYPVIHICFNTEFIRGIVCFIKTDLCRVITLCLFMTHCIIKEFVSCRCRIRVVKLSKHTLQRNVCDLYVISFQSIFNSVKNNGVHMILIVRLEHRRNCVVMSLSALIVIAIETGLMIVIIILILIDPELALVKVDRRGCTFQRFNLPYCIGRPTVIRTTLCNGNQIKRSIVVPGSQMFCDI